MCFESDLGAQKGVKRGGFGHDRFDAVRHPVNEKQSVCRSGNSHREEVRGGGGGGKDHVKVVG